MQLLVDDEWIGRITDIDGPAYSIDSVDVTLDPNPAPYTELIPVLNARTVTVSLNPWRIPNGMMPSMMQGKACAVVFETPFRPAWWGRIKNRLLGRFPPSVRITWHGIIKALELTTEALRVGIAVASPIDIADPRSRLEVAWNRVCHLRPRHVWGAVTQRR